MSESAPTATPAATDVHEWLAAISGHRFRDPSLLERAMSHRSWCAENDGAESNERLEFLGDAVLGWIVADLVMKKYPDLDEGQLTDLRKSLVSAEALASMANEIGLGRWIRLSSGERDGGGHTKTSILADALEATIGAVYLDGGVPRARTFVRKLVTKRMRQVRRRLAHIDARSQLIQVCVREFGRPPVVTTSGAGAAHEPVFTASIVVEGDELGRAVGPSKKSAIQSASAEALAVLARRGIDTSRA